MSTAVAIAESVSVCATPTCRAPLRTAPARQRGVCLRCFKLRRDEDPAIPAHRTYEDELEEAAAARRERVPSEAEFRRQATAAVKAVDGVRERHERGEWDMRPAVQAPQADAGSILAAGPRKYESPIPHYRSGGSGLYDDARWGRPPEKTYEPIPEDPAELARLAVPVPIPPKLPTPVAMAVAPVPDEAVVEPVAHDEEPEMPIEDARPTGGITLAYYEEIEERIRTAKSPKGLPRWAHVLWWCARHPPADGGDVFVLRDVCAAMRPRDSYGACATVDTLDQRPEYFEALEGGRFRLLDGSAMRVRFGVSPPVKETVMQAKTDPTTRPCERAGCTKSLPSDSPHVLCHQHRPRRKKKAKATKKIAIAPKVRKEAKTIPLDLRDLAELTDDAIRAEHLRRFGEPIATPMPFDAADLEWDQLIEAVRELDARCTEGDRARGLIAKVAAATKGR